jgi:eukaryotic-like serine/threonine-protein kinase
MEAPEAALAPGSTLDRYELLCPLAEGGMATVWLARMRGTRGFEKLVAIKIIKAELVDDPRFEEMFLDEARIASEIAHPNVAQIIDLGEKNGILYLVMEWVDGESVAKVRKFAAKARVRIPLGLSLRIIADACAGLHAAHELKGKDGLALGVVHRDVSPQNILISTAGAVKVIDFGVAKAQNRLATRTRTGVVKGKVQYMAPEQARGEDHDRRVDVWALGVCLYELVADRLPFDGDNPLEVLSRITSDDPPPIEEVVPQGVRDLVAKALARNPDSRFATAAAMRRAIEAVLGNLGVDSSAEDVAAFVDSYMPNRATERQDIVGRALKAAEARARGAVDAFTGTMEVQWARAPGSPGAPDSAGRIRAPASTPGLVTQSGLGGYPPGSQVPVRHPPPAFSARAIIDQETPSRAPLWIAIVVLLLGAGGFAMWQLNPGLVRSLYARISPAPAEPAAPSPSASASAVESAAPPPAPAPSDNAAASDASLEAGPDSASASESASAAASATPPKARKHGWPKATDKPSAPLNSDWLPKESEIPKIAPSPPPADPAH